MNNDILDADHFNPDNWDSKKRVKVSDAIIEVNDHVRKARYGRHFLFCLAAINFFLPLMVVLSSELVPKEMLYITIVSVAIMALPFLVFGALFSKKPLLFLVLGLVFYLASLVLTMVLTGESIVQGYGRKVAVVAIFGFAIFSVFRWKSNLDKLIELGYPSSAIAEARRRMKPLPRLRKKKA